MRISLNLLFGVTFTWWLPPITEREWLLYEDTCRVKSFRTKYAWNVDIYPSNSPNGFNSNRTSKKKYYGMDRIPCNSSSSKANSLLYATKLPETGFVMFAYGTVMHREGLSMQVSFKIFNNFNEALPQDDYHCISSWLIRI